MNDKVSTWRRFLEPEIGERPGIPNHHRGTTLAAPTPGARVVELTQELARAKEYLQEAVSEVLWLRGREEKDVYHTFSGTSFGGVPMAQYWCDLVVWEGVLNTHKDTILSIIEIGTWQGGFSNWLYAQCRVRGWDFMTVDAVVPERRVPHFERKDVFAEPEWIISRLGKSWGGTLLFCDGGNKPRELKTFAPYLGAHDIIAVHDWGDETLGSDVPGSLSMLHRDYCESMGSITRFFRRAD